MKKVVIQGIPGAFHEIAARNYFASEKIHVIPSRTFAGLFKMISTDHELHGIVAVENSLAGSILPNLTLLKDSGVTITGECKLRIALNLLALPGQSITDIREVLSHPVALLQCTEFFKQYPEVRITESDDTAKSAMDIRRDQLRGVGVIASALAGQLYNLETLAQGIETNKRNFTRFFIVEGNPARNSVKKRGSKIKNKASIVFTLAHERGSLSVVLTMLAKMECNLMMIQSNPVIGREWEYLFYIDLLFSNSDKFSEALREMQKICNEVKVLGVYQAGEVYSEENSPAGEIENESHILELWNKQ